MNHRPFFHVLLFLASMIIAGSLVFGLSGCSKQDKAPQPKTTKTAPQPAAPTPPAIPVNAPVSVDFDNMALSSVAQFVTAQTGKGLILSGLESKPITWIESNMTKEKIFDSFKAALTASGLLLKPANDQEPCSPSKKQRSPRYPFAWTMLSPAGERSSFSAPRSTLKPLFPIPCNTKPGTTSPWCRNPQRSS